MRDYGVYVAGQDRPSEQRVYQVRASEMLRDPLGAVRLKRGLERGRLPEEAARAAAADGRLIGSTAVGDAHDMEAALNAAAGAVDDWAATPLATRIALVAAFHDLVRENEDALVELLITEGHPRRLARWEVAGMLATTSSRTRDWIAGNLEHHASVDGRRMTLRRVADGVVCLNPPQNAAVANTLLGVWVLAAGNSLVVRAPRSAAYGVMHALHTLVVPALERVGAPVGVLNAVCVPAGPALEQWLESPLVDDIMHFGDSVKGVEFGARCVAAGKKPVLELAGNDTVVVWRDADLDRAAEALAEAFYGSGQICMVPNCVVVHPAVADELLERLAARARTIRPGYPEQDDALLSPVLRTDAFFEALEESLASGARLVCGGRRLGVDGEPDDTAGTFLEPTVLRVDGLKGARGLRTVRHETFFPLLPVVVPEPPRAGTDPEPADRELLDEITSFVNTNEYGLRNSLWARDPAVVDRFVARVRNGGLLKVNDSHIGFLPLLPSHGGTGLTGGPGGEANYPALRTSHLQGVSVAVDARPGDAVSTAPDRPRDLDERRTP
ncbi:aldehyde dehydrogenase [Streptomyces sp. NPDC007346]|uniref:aldehyde dehydrogenase family protein n=1 Tax=Streptomyces sp. NPDC007346 TaxID=3154682 RepID=UPI0034546DAA